MKQLIQRNANIQFFEDLEDLDPTLVSTIEIINISLDETIGIKNLFFIRVVMNEIILRANLKHLTLNYFPPQTLIAILATLSSKHKLETINLEFNKLTTDYFIMVLECLSPKTLVNLNISNNILNDEERIALHLIYCRNLKSITIKPQLSIL